MGIYIGSGLSNSFGEGTGTSKASILPIDLSFLSVVGLAQWLRF